MADAINTIKTILETNWNSSNTDGITPIFDYIVNQKTINLANNDYILLYELDEGHRPYGIGGQDFEESPTVSIDIRTTYKRAHISDIRDHLIKLKDEVLRIIKANIAKPDSDYQLLLPVRKKDLSDKTIGIGRMVFDVQLKKWS